MQLVEYPISSESLTGSLLAAPAAFAAPANKVIAAVDTDSDGTIDIKEVQAVAGAVFDKLEKDADGTLARITEIAPREFLRVTALRDRAVTDGIDPDSHEVWNTILEGSHG